MSTQTKEAEYAELKEVVWDEDRDVAVVETGHATYDAQTNAIGTGNYWANTLHGNFIRPYTETECNGLKRPEGHFRRFDLKYYHDIGAPHEVLQGVRAMSRDRQVILYALFHFNEQGYGRRPKRIVHGYILTDENDRLLDYWITGPTHKSRAVVETVLPYIARRPIEQ